MERQSATLELSLPRETGKDGACVMACSKCPLGARADDRARDFTENQLEVISRLSSYLKDTGGEIEAIHFMSGMLSPELRITPPPFNGVAVRKLAFNYGELPSQAIDWKTEARAIHERSILLLKEVGREKTVPILTFLMDIISRTGGEMATSLGLALEYYLIIQQALETPFHKGDFRFSYSHNAVPAQRFDELNMATITPAIRGILEALTQSFHLKDAENTSQDNSKMLYWDRRGTSKGGVEIYTGFRFVKDTDETLPITEIHDHHPSVAIFGKHVWVRHSAIATKDTSTRFTFHDFNELITIASSEGKPLRKVIAEKVNGRRLEAHLWNSQATLSSSYSA